MKRTHAQQAPLFALRRLALLAVPLVLAACATTPSSTLPTAPGETQAAGAPAAANPEQRALNALVAQQDRLYRVAAPLLVSNADLCRSNARNLLGFTAKTKYSYSQEYVDAAQAVLGLDDALRVTGVLPGSGAARAGVQRGDALLAVEGTSMPQGENAERQASALLAPLVTGRSSVKLTVRRNGAELPLTVPLTYACAFGIELGNADNAVAYADGYRVLVTRGMLNAVQSDEELAYLLAKEMAHNALAHAIRQHMSATVGGIIDNLIRMHPDLSVMVGLAGVKPMPAELDVMADRLSLYMLARAGYRIDGAVAFWRRLAAQYPVSTLNAYTALHPATEQRIAAMEKTIKDIKAKQATKKPLMP